MLVVCAWLGFRMLWPSVSYMLHYLIFHYFLPHYPIFKTFSPKDFFVIAFRERREGKKEGREILIGCFPHTTRLGPKLATQACAQARN